MRGRACRWERSESSLETSDGRTESFKCISNTIDANSLPQLSSNHTIHSRTEMCTLYIEINRNFYKIDLRAHSIRLCLPFASFVRANCSPWPPQKSAVPCIDYFSSAALFRSKVHIYRKWMSSFKIDRIHPFRIIKNSFNRFRFYWPLM